MRRLLLVACVLASGCAARSPTGPAWPKDPARDGDGGESIAPRVVRVAEPTPEPIDPTPVAVAAPIEAAPVVAAPAPEVGAVPAAAQPSAVVETITTEEIVIEINSDD